MISGDSFGIEFPDCYGFTRIPIDGPFLLPHPCGGGKPPAVTVADRAPWNPDPPGLVYLYFLSAE